MKKLLLVIVLCGCGGMLKAETYKYENGMGDHLWNTAGNWETNDVVATTPPTAGDNVEISSAKSVTISDGVTASANQVIAIVGNGRMIVESGATLNVGGLFRNGWSAPGFVTTNAGIITVGKNLEARKNNSVFDNTGTVNVGLKLQVFETGNFNNMGTLNPTGSLEVKDGTFRNYGTINSANGIYVGWSGGYAGISTFYNAGVITINNNKDFHLGWWDGGASTSKFTMASGSLTADKLNFGTFEAGNVSHIDLLGGEMTFNSVGTFTSNYTMDVQGGEFIVGGDHKTTFETAIANGYITGGAGLKVSYEDGDTIISSPPAGTVISIQ